MPRGSPSSSTAHTTTPFFSPGGPLSHVNTLSVAPCTADRPPVLVLGTLTLLVLAALLAAFADVAEPTRGHLPDAAAAASGGNGTGGNGNLTLDTWHDTQFSNSTHLVWNARLANNDWRTATLQYATQCELNWSLQNASGSTLATGVDGTCGSTGHNLTVNGSSNHFYNPLSLPRQMIMANGTYTIVTETHMSTPPLRDSFTFSWLSLDTALDTQRSNSTHVVWNTRLVNAGWSATLQHATQRELNWTLQDASGVTLATGVDGTCGNTGHNLTLTAGSTHSYNPLSQTMNGGGMIMLNGTYTIVTETHMSAPSLNDSFTFSWSVNSGTGGNGTGGNGTGGNGTGGNGTGGNGTGGNGTGGNGTGGNGTGGNGNLTLDTWLDRQRSNSTHLVWNARLANNDWRTATLQYATQCELNWSLYLHDASTTARLATGVDGTCGSTGHNLTVNGSSNHFYNPLSLPRQMIMVNGYPIVTLSPRQIMVNGTYTIVTETHMSTPPLRDSFTFRWPVNSGTGGNGNLTLDTALDRQRSNSTHVIWNARLVNTGWSATLQYLTGCDLSWTLQDASGSTLATGADGPACTLGIRAIIHTAGSIHTYGSRSQTMNSGGMIMPNGTYTIVTKTLSTPPLRDSFTFSWPVSGTGGNGTGGNGTGGDGTGGNQVPALSGAATVAAVTAGAVVVATFAAGGAATVMSEPIRWPLYTKAAAFVALVAKGGETAGGEYQRGRIVGYLASNQGCHLAALVRGLGLGNHQAAHHLRMLADRGLIWHRRDGRRLRFYTSDVPRDSPASDLPLPDLIAAPDSGLMHLLCALVDLGSAPRPPKPGRARPHAGVQPAPHQPPSAHPARPRLDRIPPRRPAHPPRGHRSRP